MNKKADLGDMTMILSFAFLLIVIGSGIAIGIAMFYSSNYDFRETDAVLLNYKLSKCLLNNQFPEDNIETQLYTLCNINKKVIEEHFQILLSLNDEEQYNFKLSETTCALSDKNPKYPKCKTSILKTKQGQIKIITASDQQSRSKLA